MSKSEVNAEDQAKGTWSSGIKEILHTVWATYFKLIILTVIPGIITIIGFFFGIDRLYDLFLTTSQPMLIYDNGLAFDFGIGAETSLGKDDGWIENSPDGELCMMYPSGYEWGAVYIVIGDLESSSRRHIDMSIFRKLSFDARALTDDADVSVGIKDITDTNGGLESKLPVQKLSKVWRPYEYELEDFVTADLSQLYVVIEFIFVEPDTSVCVKNIQYKS